MNAIDADVVVLGSGFGGSLMSLILHKIGLRPVLIDRVTHPRFAIGESSTPIANLVLRDLATRYDLPRLVPLTRFGSARQTYPDVTLGLKRGFSYFHHETGRPFTPDDAHANELLVAASLDDHRADTHWLRADVDRFLVDEVRAAGISFFDDTTVTSFERSDGWRISAERRGGPLQFRATFAIDATGESGILLRALGIPRSADGFKTNSRAIFAHFRGVQPWQDLHHAAGGDVAVHPFCCDDAALHQVFDGGWMWQLRFHNGIVSAGIAIDCRQGNVANDLSPEQQWNVWLDRYPSLAEQFARASLVAPAGGLQRTARLQRLAATIAGDNWAALPNTAGFVDPLHSTGIAHTICGIERLAGILERSWQQPDLAGQLQQYESVVRSEIELIDQLVAGQYLGLGNFPLFAAYAMLYFAAATTYERRRISGSCAADAFLCAGDAAFRQVARLVWEELNRITCAVVAPRQAAEFPAFVASLIRPFNTAGLCNPSVRNMYRFTAAPDE